MSAEKNYHTSAVCRGCRHSFAIHMEKRPTISVNLPMVCPHCDSDLMVQVKPSLFRAQVQTRSKMIRHSEGLLEILGIENEAD